MASIIILLIVCIILLIIVRNNQSRIKLLKETVNDLRILIKVKDITINNEKKNIQFLCNQIKEQE